jgi:hypothetical protein
MNNPTSFPNIDNVPCKNGRKHESQRVTALQRLHLTKNGKAVYLHDLRDQNHINVNAGIGESLKTAAGIEQVSGKAVHQFREHKQKPS